MSPIRTQYHIRNDYNLNQIGGLRSFFDLLILNLYYYQLSCLSKGGESFAPLHLVFLNPSGGGGLIVPTIFSDGYFSMKKGSGGPKFRDCP